SFRCSPSSARGGRSIRGSCTRWTLRRQVAPPRERCFLSIGPATNGMESYTGRLRSGWPDGRGTGSAMSDLVVGIDLGTTNSEVAAFVDGRVRVLGPNPSKMLPSCVGIAPSGELLVGESALNQQRIYPERTVRSIKRKMGSDETVMMAGKGFSPQEIS